MFVTPVPKALSSRTKYTYHLWNRTREHRYNPGLLHLYEPKVWKGTRFTYLGKVSYSAQVLGNQPMDENVCPSDYKWTSSQSSPSRKQIWFLLYPKQRSMPPRNAIRWSTTTNFSWWDQKKVPPIAWSGCRCTIKMIIQAESCNTFTTPLPRIRTNNVCMQILQPMLSVSTIQCHGNFYFLSLMSAFLTVLSSYMAYLVYNNKNLDTLFCFSLQ